jgi:hypothetical protein
MAEEAVIFSYLGEEMDVECYKNTYLEDIIFDSEEEKKLFIKEFSNNLELISEINKRIVKSENYELLSTLFAEESFSQWEILHNYLMKGGLPELGYYKMDLNESEDDEYDDLYFDEI